MDEDKKRKKKKGRREKEGDEEEDSPRKKSNDRKKKKSSKSKRKVSSESEKTPPKSKKKRKETPEESEERPIKSRKTEKNEDELLKKESEGKIESGKGTPTKKSNTEISKNSKKSEDSKIRKNLSEEKKAIIIEESEVPEAKNDVIKTEDLFTDENSDINPYYNQFKSHQFNLEIVTICIPN